MTTESEAIAMLSLLGSAKPAKVDPDDHIILVRFWGATTGDEMLAFATAVNGTDVRRLDCGPEGILMLLQFKKVWLIIPEKDLVFLTLKYAMLFEQELTAERMHDIIANTTGEGNKNVFLMLSLIGFQKSMGGRRT
jgi:hypothetical protein